MLLEAGEAAAPFETHVSDNDKDGLGGKLSSGNTGHYEAPRFTPTPQQQSLYSESAEDGPLELPQNGENLNNLQEGFVRQSFIGKAC